MPIALNRSDFTQTVFKETSVGVPAFVNGLLTMVPDVSVDVRNVVIGQTEPPLVRKIDAQTVADLTLDGTWTYRLRIVRRSDGIVRVDSTSVVFSLQADGSGHLTYDLGANDFDLTGAHSFQFRATRASDNRVLYWEHETMQVRSP